MLAKKLHVSLTFSQAIGKPTFIRKHCKITYRKLNNPITYCTIWLSWVSVCVEHRKKDIFLFLLMCVVTWEIPRRILLSQSSKLNYIKGSCRVVGRHYGLHCWVSWPLGAAPTVVHRWSRTPEMKSAPSFSNSPAGQQEGWRLQCTRCRTWFRGLEGENFCVFIKQYCYIWSFGQPCVNFF